MYKVISVFHEEAAIKIQSWFRSGFRGVRVPRNTYLGAMRWVKEQLLTDDFKNNPNELLLKWAGDSSICCIPPKYVLQALIKTGADVNYESPWGQVVLHSAVNSGKIEVVKLLLDSKVDVNKLPKNRTSSFINPACTALHLAIKIKKLDIAKLLIGVKSISINAGDYKCDTALHYALRFINNQDAVRLLLGVKKININAQNEFGCTPLHLAAHFGKEEILNILLKFGADPFVKDERGETALDKAAKFGGAQMALILAMIELLVKESKDFDDIKSFNASSPENLYWYQSAFNNYNQTNHWWDKEFKSKIDEIMNERAKNRS